MPRVCRESGEKISSLARSANNAAAGFSIQVRVYPPKTPIFTLHLILLALCAGTPMASLAQRPAAVHPPEPPLATGAVLQYRGMVKKLGGGSILLMLDDSRPLLLKTGGKTRYFQNGDSAKSNVIKLGDWLSVEAELDPFSQLQATSVNVLPREQGEALAKDAAEAAAAAEKDSGEGNGRYTLQRGPAVVSEPPPEGFDPDFLIERARLAAESFAGTLPNFIAQEAMSRYQAGGRSVGWQLDDVISVEVVYEDGQERYRNVRVNDAPTTKKMEDLSGSWSTGEFASTQSALLDERTDAKFTWVGQAKEKRGTQNFRAAVYNFAVTEANSHWHVSAVDETAKSRELLPAYRGSVWIDIDSARVLRIEMAATSLPFDYPLNTVESAVDYAMVDIGDQPTLLPTRAESVACQRGGNNCSRNVIDFRRYRKFTTDAIIDFGAVDDEPK